MLKSKVFAVALVLMVLIGMTPFRAQSAAATSSNQFDGTYTSVVENTPALSGTMVIDGLSVRYSCPTSDGPVSDVQFTRNTVLFRLTADGTTYTFLGIYSVDANGTKRFKGIVGKGTENASRSAFAPGGSRSPFFPSASNSFLGARHRRNVMDDNATWQAEATL
jgi:hypothetical protein